MIILDTNVVSETLRRQPSPAVQTWLDEQIAETLYLTSVTLAELLYGVYALPAGRRRDELNRAVEGIAELYAARTLPFDARAARRHADLAARARAAGRGLPTPDAYIAAIAAASGFCVASRDTAPFEAAGVAVINPWGKVA
jgi:predicted nucleic acid-binding protein